MNSKSSSIVMNRIKYVCFCKSVKDVSVSQKYLKYLVAEIYKLKNPFLAWI